MNKSNVSVCRLFLFFFLRSCALYHVWRKKKYLEGHYLLSAHTPSVFVARRRALFICAAKVSSAFSCADTVFVRPAERSHISGPNVLISASLVVAFFFFVETVPAALLLTLAWLEAGFSLAEQEHSHKWDRRGREDYLQPPFWFTSFLCQATKQTIGHGSPVFNYACIFFSYLLLHARAGGL